jgi:hypothetical protein
MKMVESAGAVIAGASLPRQIANTACVAWL